MKKLGTLLASVAIFTAHTVSADVIGLTAGAELWQGDLDGRAGNTAASQSLNFNDDHRKAFYVAFEHPLPLLPNVAVRQQWSKHDGNSQLVGDLRLGNTRFPATSSIENQLAINYTDVTFYYELLDNPVLDLDLGLTTRWLDTETVVVSNTTRASVKASAPLPMLYLKSAVHVMGTNTSVFFDGNYSNYSDNTVYDARLGLAYQFVDLPAFNLWLKVGVQRLDVDLTNEDGLDIASLQDGVFIALELDL